GGRSGERRSKASAVAERRVRAAGPTSERNPSPTPSARPLPMGELKQRHRASDSKLSPAFVRHDRRLLRAGLGPDRHIVLPVLQLDDEAGGQRILALVVELDALVAE